VDMSIDGFQGLVGVGPELVRITMDSINLVQLRRRSSGSSWTGIFLDWLPQSDVDVLVARIASFPGTTRFRLPEDSSRDARPPNTSTAPAPNLGVVLPDPCRWRNPWGQVTIQRHHCTKRRGKRLDYGEIYSGNLS